MHDTWRVTFSKCTHLITENWEVSESSYSTSPSKRSRPSMIWSWRTRSNWLGGRVTPPRGICILLLPSFLHFSLNNIITSSFFLFVCVFLAVILFCFVFPIPSVGSPLVIGSCFCLFLFPYFEPRCNILPLFMLLLFSLIHFVYV